MLSEGIEGVHVVVQKENAAGCSRDLVQAGFQGQRRFLHVNCIREREPIAVEPWLVLRCLYHLRLKCVVCRQDREGL